MRDARIGVRLEEAHLNEERIHKMTEKQWRTIARAVDARRLESRNVARRKVVELAADVADVLYDAQAARFTYAMFYQACGFTDVDLEMAQSRNAVL
jgi:hypothetical protein